MWPSLSFMDTTFTQASQHSGRSPAEAPDPPGLACRHDTPAHPPPLPDRPSYGVPPTCQEGSGPHYLPCMGDRQAGRCVIPWEEKNSGAPVACVQQAVASVGGRRADGGGWCGGATTSILMVRQQLAKNDGIPRHSHSASPAWAHHRLMAGWAAVGLQAGAGTGAGKLRRRQAGSGNAHTTPLTVFALYNNARTNVLRDARQHCCLTTQPLSLTSSPVPNIERRRLYHSSFSHGGAHAFSGTAVTRITPCDNGAVCVKRLTHLGLRHAASHVLSTATSLP